MSTHFEMVGQILDNLPADWVTLTTHRLDIYDESQAKSQFLERLIALGAGGYTAEALEALPTAYDYIRLGHPLSCVLEWVLADLNGLPVEQVIAYTSRTMPVLAILRQDALEGRASTVYYDGDEAPLMALGQLRETYGYEVTVKQVASASEVAAHDDGTVLFVTRSPFAQALERNPNINVTVNVHPGYGSVLLIHSGQGIEASSLAARAQHVRRRETIAMTPPNTLAVLQEMVGRESSKADAAEGASRTVFSAIQDNTGSSKVPLLASSGLSIQYAILMGLIGHSVAQHAGKVIRILLPRNCYGGTNDQARRVAALIEDVEIVDLAVDGEHDLVSSLEVALKEVAAEDGVPIVVAEIPTNPRVEVPDMTRLAAVLSESRRNLAGAPAVKPIFMVDQTFCPNVKLLGADGELAGVETISFASGSKFASGGRCIAGYCAGNDAAERLLASIRTHLTLSDNAAIDHQVETLAQFMPSIQARVQKAYDNTRAFVTHIQGELPDVKINFVSEALAAQGFTPSVFSMDLPDSLGVASGEGAAEAQRLRNVRLIEHMISELPDQCKHCVSYGQLKGSYWTIPATSTQGTTRESDKDYIVRVSLSPDVDVPGLCAAFSAFCRHERAAHGV